MVMMGGRTLKSSLNSLCCAAKKEEPCCRNKHNLSPNHEMTAVFSVKANTKSNSQFQSLVTTRVLYIASKMRNYILCILFLFIVALTIPRACSANIPSVMASKTTLGTQKSPFDIYSHKLSLFTSENGTATAATTLTHRSSGTKIFPGAVNATKGDTYLMNDVVDPNKGKTITEINSLRLNCEGLECPRSELLQQSSSELMSNKNNYPPKHLDQDFESAYHDQDEYESSEGFPSSNQSATRIYFKSLGHQKRPSFHSVDSKENHKHRKTKSSDEESSEYLRPEHGAIVSGFTNPNNLGPLRIFKYITDPGELQSAVDSQNDTLSDAREVSRERDAVKGDQEGARNEEQTEEQHFPSESTTTERSLIPNSYFERSQDEKKVNPNETTTIIINGTLDDGFRPRRSPFRPHWRDHRLYTHSREALYDVQPPPRHLHPPPPGLAPVAFPVPQNPQAFIPMTDSVLDQSPISVVTIPVSVPLSLPYNRNQGNDFHQIASDRNFNNNAAIPDSESPEEQSTFRFTNFQHPFAKRKPQFDKQGRRHPKPSGSRHRPRHPGPVPSVMPPPKPIPLPRPRPQIYGSPSGRTHAQPLRRPPPHHHHMQSQNIHGVVPSSRPPSNVQYSYPKNAANIQDILTFFKTDDNEIPGSNTKPSLGASSIPSLSTGGGFSSEFRDVQTSLLKDIKNFAKRPSMLASGKDVSGESSSIPVPSPKPSVLPLVDPEDPLEDILEPKPKPVREMIRYRPQESDKKESSKDRERQRYKKYNENDNYDEKRPQSYDDDRKGSNYYDDDIDDGLRENTQNRYESTERGSGGKKHRDRDYRDRGLSSLRDKAKEEISKEEGGYRSPVPRQRYGFKDSSLRSHQHHRNNNNQNDYRNDDSDERPYPKNPYTSQSNNHYYPYNDRERTRDHHFGHNDHITKPYANHFSKPFKNSHPNRKYPKGQKNRHHKYRRQKHRHAGTNVQERYRLRGRGNGDSSQSHERVRQSSEFQPSPTKVATSMDQAYYQQRNRPIVIKRPYQTYRPVDVKKVEEKRKQQDQYWNSVGTVNVQSSSIDDKIAPSFRPPTIQKHYHYYGVNSIGNQPPQPPQSSLIGGNTLDRSLSSSIRRPIRFNDINISPEEDILEIHTGSGLADVSTTPVYPVGGGPTRGYPTDREKKARLQKMYMEYLQRKLDAQSEAQAESMLTTPATSTLKPKRPMRMKIHIYPNEKLQVVDHTNNQNQLYQPNNISPYISASNNIYNPTLMGNNNILHRSYGHFQPTQTMIPPMVHQSANIVPTQSVVSSNVHTGGPRSPPSGTSSIDKNKNLVLHLHVHRRNDDAGIGRDQMEMAGSDIVTSTAKPLTYEEIYETSNNKDIQTADNPSMYDMEQHFEATDEQTQGTSNQDNHGEGALGLENDKSLSMELPIHQDKIEDVLSTLLKLRKQ